MQKKWNIEEKISQDLESLDDLRRAETGAWFYSRVKAKLAAGRSTPWEVAGNFLSRPVVAFCGVLFILAMNVLVMTNSTAPRNINVASHSENTVAESESIIASSSSFEYEKIAQ
jgi:hypothetical protein